MREQNNVSALKEASEHLSANGFPSTSQFIDVTKPEPIRMDLDISMISPVTVAAPIPDPPAQRAQRGRGRAPARPPDPAPQPAPVDVPIVNPPITPER